LESIDEDDAPKDAKIDLTKDLTRHDARRLKDLIERHNSYTGSGRARQILDLWDQYLPMFVKVFPVDYRRALLEMQTSSQMEEREDVSVLAGE
jgi:glutamate synthase (NADPH/NADH) large chain